MVEANIAPELKLGSGRKNYSVSCWLSSDVGFLFHFHCDILSRWDKRDFNQALQECHSEMGKVWLSFYKPGSVFCANFIFVFFPTDIGSGILSAEEPSVYYSSVPAMANSDT